MTKIPRLKPVESSNIKAVGYRKKDRLLAVEFANGSVYTFTNVPQDEYNGLIKAESVGKYFYRHVRDEYDYEKQEAAK